MHISCILIFVVTNMKFSRPKKCKRSISWLYICVS